MTFDHPGGLWWLALAVPIVAFHFYRGKIRTLAVPSLLFWEQILVEEEQRTALRRLRHWASLLLGLLAVCLLTSAVAGPNVPGLTRPKGRYAILLDNTPSLAAAGEGRTRLDEAVDRARAFISTLGHGEQVSIHDLGGPRRPFTTDLEAAAAELVAPPPVAGADLRARVEAALGAGDDVTAVLFTDRPPAGVGDLLASGRLRVARVGAPAPNVGWVSGGTVRQPGGKRVAIALEAASFSPAPERREEVLHFNGKELARRSLELEPGARTAREWSLDPSRFPGAGIEEGGLARVVLEPPDALALDDRACFVVPPLLPPIVIVFHPGQPDEFLMRALESLRTGGQVHPELLSAPVGRYGAMRSRIGEGWIAVFDRVAPPGPRAPGGTLVLGAPGGTRVEHPAVADWDREAPPNRLVDYGGLLLKSSRILDGAPLLRAVEGTIATWSSRGGEARVELGFALADAELRPALPMLLFNVVEWAGWRGLRSFRTEYRVGEPLRAERPVWIDEGELAVEAADPPSRPGRVAVRGGRPLSAPPAGAGFVRIGGAGREEWVAVNLFDAAESDLREPPPSADPPLPPPAPWTAKVPWAVPAAALVLLLLVAEGFLFWRGWI